MGMPTTMNDSQYFDACRDEEAAESRAGDRYPVVVGSRVRVGARLHPLAILNLSVDGFRGECDCAVPPGTAIAAELPVLGFVRGQVRWADNNTIGASFQEPLTPDECRRALMPAPERRAGANDAWLRAAPPAGVSPAARS